MKWIRLRACAWPACLVVVLLTVLLIAPAQQAASTRAAGFDLAQQDEANLAGERVSAPALADTLPINHGAPALAQLLLKLRTRASLMLIVAHPDDEDGGMLTYESRGQGARVAMLTLNRGEGGQNLMSGDFDDALGLMRTQELLAADRYLGVDQMFSSVVDFGFSKTREESLQKWGHDRVLYDAVRAVRLYRPLVLTSVFVGGVTDGHGQHQVSGEINQEVFNAAGDPNVFPEMGLPPWAPLKVYARAPFARIDAQGMFDYATGKYSPARFYNYVTQKWSDTAPQAAVVVHEGEVSTALGMDGMSYVQFARKGLALQKSQNGGASRGGGGGTFDAGYARYGSRIPNSPATEQTLFDGIDITLPGIATLAPSASAVLHADLKAGLAKIDASTAEAQRLFDPARPELTAPPLREALRTLDGLMSGVERSTFDSTEKFNVLHELRIKRVQANNALVLAHGLNFSATLADQDTILAGTKMLSINRHLENKGAIPIRQVMYGLTTPVSNLEEFFHFIDGKNILNPGASTDVPGHFTLPKGLPATRPYFSRIGLEQPYYDISDAALRNAPATPAPLSAYVVLDDQGVRLTIAATVSAMDGQHSAQAAVVVPPVSVSLSQSAGIIPIQNKSFSLAAHVRSNTAERASGVVVLGLSSAGTISADKPEFSLAKAGDSADILFNVPASAITMKQSTLSAVVTEDHHEYREGFRAVGYPGLAAYTNYYTQATFKAATVDVHTAPGLRVAYLPGTGDDVPAYLPDLGVTPIMLTLGDLTAAKLAQYDAVVLGVRAYAAHPELAGAGSQPLMEYAKSGGVVIVQYNTSRYGEADAPFPISVPGSADMNVVVEEAPVKLLVPDSPVLTWPNRITSADFDHWVAERGHGFARSWGPEFQALLETHDPGQDEEKGGLLLARVGKGYYIYTGLALYRQLPEGVPGAYRLFANLISLGKYSAAK